MAQKAGLIRAEILVHDKETDAAQELLAGLSAKGRAGRERPLRAGRQGAPGPAHDGGRARSDLAGRAPSEVERIVMTYTRVKSHRA